MAERFLLARGARVLARNLRVWPGEIDLLVDWEGLLAAVEVKTRVGADPIEEMTFLKAERLRRAGGRLPVPPRRYDLVTVRLSADGVGVRWIQSVC